MTEKQQIEVSTAEGFLTLFNKHFASTYRMVEHSDAPDIRCEDESGGKLNLEVTTTEDQPRDIQALLGRSGHRSIEALAEHNERVIAGIESPRFTSFDGAVKNLIVRIRGKVRNDYGGKTALVIRDTSGLDWDWDEVTDRIATELNEYTNPFDRGIWVLSKDKSKLFQIVPGQNETAT